MADKRIDQLTAATSLDDSDLLVVEQSSEAKKATGTVVSNYINSKFGLSGMASAISTLQTAVAGKQDALTLPIPVAQGGTGAEDAANARVNLGLGTAAVANIDATLSAQGAAADAKAVGDGIDNIESTILFDASSSLTWAVGAISSSNGTNSTSTTRLRTNNYIPKSTSAISVESGYKYILFAYSNGSYVGTWNGTNFTKTGNWRTTSLYLKSLPDYDYKLVFADSNDIAMSVDYAENIHVMTYTDESLSIQGKAADANATGEAIDDLLSKLSDITSCSPAEFIQGGYYTTPDTGGTSTFVAADGWCCTKIPHDTGKTVFAVVTGGAGVQRAYAYLREDGTVASRSSANLTLDGSPITTANADVRYIVINNKLSSIPDGYYAFWTSGAYSPTLKTIIDRAIVQRSNSLITDLDVDFVPGYFSYTTSNHPAHTPSIIDGKSFTLINFAFTYESRSIQIIISQAASGSENESLVMYRWKISTVWSAWVTLSKVGDSTQYWCYGKTINWTGDSIVSGGDFDEFTSEALGMIETDYGISGSTIALAADGTDGRNAIVARYSSMSDDADVVAVSAGSNDWMYAWCPIGDMSSTSNSTFYGALKNLCKGLMTKYPTKVIFFTTPIKRAQEFTSGNGGTYTPDGVYTDPSSKNKYGKTLMDYCDIIKEVCGYYGIPVCDLNRESGLNPSIAAQADLFEDKTHPSSAGKRIQARRMAGWITQLAYRISG